MKPTVPLALALAFALALASAGCDRASPVPVARAAAAPAAGPAARLVFFMNPHGRPCQLQDDILRGVEADLAGRVQVVRLRTTEPSELAAFQAYGVRALPLLVVTDAAGNEVRRATPGIQDAAGIRALVGP